MYAAAVYLLFLAVFGYAIGFFAGVGVSKAIDQGPRAAVPVTVAIDLLLLLLFAVQHTLMARPWFKRRWMRIVPAPAERHLLFAAAATGYIMAGIAFEEHDLIQSLGDSYAFYRARVPALIPRPRPHLPPRSRQSNNDRRQAT